MNNPNFDSQEVLDYRHQLELTNSFYNGFDTSTDYIIPFFNEDKDSFATRLKLARLTNYVRDAVETVKNMVLRKPTKYDELIDSALSPFLETIDMKNNIDTFSKEVLTNLVKDGYTYILIEKESYEDVVSGADEINKRPYFINVKRSAVRNFKINDDGSFKQFTYDENYTIEDGYKEKLLVQQRCYLADGTVEIWRDGALYSTMQNGLGFIPIIKLGNDDISRFYDLAVINRNHLNLKSEQRNYARIASAPIPITYLLNSEDTVKTIGVSNGINFDSTKSESGFEWVELGGSNNSILESLIAKDESDMQKYLVSLVSNDIQRTAKEVSLLNANNEATLNHYATILEDGLNKAFYIMALYQGINNFEAKLYINKDFIDNKLDATELNSYKEMYVNNIIDWDTYINILITGEVLEPMSDIDIAKMKTNLVNPL